MKPHRVIGELRKVAQDDVYLSGLLRRAADAIERYQKRNTNLRAQLQLAQATIAQLQSQLPDPSEVPAADDTVVVASWGPHKIHAVKVLRAHFNEPLRCTLATVRAPLPVTLTSPGTAERLIQGLRAAGAICAQGPS